MSAEVIRVEVALEEGKDVRPCPLADIYPLSKREEVSYIQMMGELRLS